MSVRKKIEKINTEVIKKTGVDFEKYRLPEVIDTITETTDFISNPLSTVSILIRAMIKVFAVIIVLFVVFYQVSDVSWWGGLILLVIGVIEFPIVGFSLGLISVVKRLTDNIVDVLVLSLDLVKEVIYDASNLKTMDKLPVSDLLKGVLFIVLLPIIKQIITEKVGILGKPILWLVERILYVFSNTATAIIAKLTSANELIVDSIDGVDKTAKEVGKTKAIAIIDQVASQIESILAENVVPKVLRLLKVIFYLSSAVMFFSLLIAYWVISVFASFDLMSKFELWWPW